MNYHIYFTDSAIYLFTSIIKTHYIAQIWLLINLKEIHAPIVNKILSNPSMLMKEKESSHPEVGV